MGLSSEEVLLILFPFEVVLLLFVVNLRNFLNTEECIFWVEGIIAQSSLAFMTFFSMQKYLIFMLKWSVFPFFPFVSGFCLLTRDFFNVKIIIFLQCFLSVSYGFKCLCLFWCDG